MFSCLVQPSGVERDNNGGKQRFLGTTNDSAAEIVIGNCTNPDIQTFLPAVEKSP